MSKYAIPIIILAGLISRLPFLLWGQLILDGDECIVGLMAKHFAEGVETPFYFYGQSYGFSFVEVSMISLTYQLFGATDLAIRLSMLLLWMLGTIFLFKTLKQIGQDPFLALLIALVFIFSPTWFIWSMKARGGYLTAFAFSTLVSWLLLDKKLSKSIWTLTWVGFCFILIYESQPLWLAGLIPILLFQFYRPKQLKSAIGFSMGLMTGLILFFSLKTGLSSFWAAKHISFGSLSLESILLIPSKIFENFTGSYYYNDIIPVSIFTELLAYIYTASLFVCLVMLLVYFFRRIKVNPLAYVFGVSVLASIGLILVMSNYSPRYALPIFGFFIMMVFACLDKFKNTKLISVLLLGLVFVGAISLFSFKDFKLGKVQKPELSLLIETLEKNDIHYIYSKGGLLQWQLMFYSQEEIIARYIYGTDRYPAYVEAVDKAFLENEPSAMVGYLSQNMMEKYPEIDSVGDKFYIYKNPPKAILIDEGFVFQDQVEEE